MIEGNANLAQLTKCIPCLILITIYIYILYIWLVCLYVCLSVCLSVCLCVCVCVCACISGRLYLFSRKNDIPPPYPDKSSTNLTMHASLVVMHGQIGWVGKFTTGPMNKWLKFQLDWTILSSHSVYLFSIRVCYTKNMAL